MTVLRGRLPRSALDAGGRGSKRYGVFVAYRFGDEASREFRLVLEKQLSQVTDRVNVFDGKVSTNCDWAEEIRRRVKASSVLVADVTGYRREIMYEFGFGAASKLALVPILVSPDGQLPRWLTRLQYRSWGNDRSRAVSEVAHMASAGQRGNPYEFGHATESRALALGVTGDLLEVIQAQCDNVSVELTRVQAQHTETGALESRQVVTAASRSGVIFASFDGSGADSFAHFVAGVMAASPKVRGRPGKRRRFIALLPTGAQSADYLSDGAQRSDDLVAVATTPDDVVRCFREWREQ
jgi:hypothetical protein